MSEFLLTYLLHSTVLLTGALLLVRLPGLRRASAREALLRTALVAGLVTSWGQHAPVEVTLGVPAEPALAALNATEARSAPVSTSDPAPPAIEETLASEPSVVAGVPGEQQTIHPRGPIAPRIPSLVLAGCILVAVLRFSHAWIVLRHVLARAEPLRDRNLLRLLKESETVSRTQVPANLLVASRIPTPFAVGRRTIVLPADIMDRLAAAGVRGVLVHELAHLERRDPLWNALLSFLASALAFQPLNLLVLRACRRASEEICDARAAAQTGEPLQLARSLVELARAPAPVPSLVAAGMAGRTHLTSRVEALLENKETHMPRSRLALLALLPLAFGSFLPVLSFAQPSTPEGAASVKQVVIDPGHGGRFPGTQGRALEEDAVLAIALEVRDQLKAQGIDVLLTREKDAPAAEGPGADLTARAARVTPGTDAFVSIHTGVGGAYLEGIRSWYAGGSDGEPETLERRSRQLATTVHEQLADDLQAHDLGVATKDYYVLKHAGVPAALVEVGFVTHPDEGQRLASEAYRQRVATSIAKGISAFLGGEAPATPWHGLALSVGTAHTSDPGEENAGTLVVIRSEDKASPDVIQSIRAPDGTVVPTASLYPQPLLGGARIRVPLPPQEGTYTADIEREGETIGLKATLEPTRQLPLPGEVTLEGDEGDLRASWDAVEGAQTYTIHLETLGAGAGAGSSTLRATTQGTSVRFDEPPANGPYSVVLRAYDFAWDGPRDQLVPPDAFPKTFAMSEARRLVGVSSRLDADLLREVVGRCELGFKTPGQGTRLDVSLPSGVRHSIRIPYGFLERSQELCVQRFLTSPDALEWVEGLEQERQQYR